MCHATWQRDRRGWPGRAADGRHRGYLGHRLVAIRIGQMGPPQAVVRRCETALWPSEPAGRKLERKTAEGVPNNLSTAGANQIKLGRGPVMRMFTSLVKASAVAAGVNSGFHCAPLYRLRLRVRNSDGAAGPQFAMIGTSICHTAASSSFLGIRRGTDISKAGP
jgi:hypothetical protein